ncbi:hypothetical protein GCM10027403_17110 [Arthrobacter tecti]
MKFAKSYSEKKAPSIVPAEQESKSAEPKRVFVISPIGSVASSERARADRFLKYIVRAALPAPAYMVERADEHDSPHAITAAMLDSIFKSHICVADITGRNPNVFYELALAHAMDKHVVIMDGDSDRSPFDIQDQRAIKYGLMPEEIEDAIDQLRAKTASMGAPSAFKDMLNPVATAFRSWTTQQQVESSGDTTEQLLLRVVERLEDKVDRVERRSDFPSGFQRELMSPSELHHLQLGQRSESIAQSSRNSRIFSGQLPSELTQLISRKADSMGMLALAEITPGGSLEVSLADGTKRDVREFLAYLEDLSTQLEFPITLTTAERSFQFGMK